VIEILPKISGVDISDCETRRIFLEMLKTLKDMTFKEFNVSNLHTDHMNLFEIFIKIFLDECNSLTDLSLPGSVEMPRIAQYNALF